MWILFTRKDDKIATQTERCKDECFIGIDTFMMYMVQWSRVQEMIIDTSIFFIDDYSCFDYVYLMKNKNESFEKFIEYKNEVENQLDKRIKTLQTDCGDEYLSNEFNAYLKVCGIIPQLIPFGTSQWDGIFKRRNQILFDMVCLIMCQTKQPLYFWGNALQGYCSPTKYCSIKFHWENLKKIMDG